MGLRIHAIKQRVIEYGDTGGFNFGAEFVASLIGCFCDSLFCGSDYPDTDQTWTVNADQFKEMLDKIERMSDEEFETLAKEQDAFEVEDEWLKREYVLEKFRAFYDEADKKDGTIYLFWL